MQQLQVAAKGESLTSPMSVQYGAWPLFHCHILDTHWRPEYLCDHCFAQSPIDVGRRSYTCRLSPYRGKYHWAWEPRVDPATITPEQKGEIEGRFREIEWMTMSEAARWRMIYQIIFPFEPPPSPDAHLTPLLDSLVRPESPNLHGNATFVSESQLRVISFFS